VSASQYPLPPLDLACYRHAARVEALGKTQALSYLDDKGRLVRRHPDGRVTLTGTHPASFKARPGR